MKSGTSGLGPVEEFDTVEPAFWGWRVQMLFTLPWSRSPKQSFATFIMYLENVQTTEDLVKIQILMQQVRGRACESSF